jgi:uncharacterized membrane protein
VLCQSSPPGKSPLFVVEIARYAPPMYRSPHLGSKLTNVPRERLVWLDLFRGAAVVVMIECHVVNTFLATSLRTGPLFHALDFLNGLVAPSFLFIAGFLHASSSQQRSGAPGVRSSGSPKRWLRLAVIAAVGYALQFPFEPLRSGDWSEAVRAFSRFNILQCLAASLALLLMIDAVVKRYADLAVTALLAVVVGAAALAQNWTVGPAPLLALVNDSTGSLFPLFPWAGFVFAGALASEWRNGDRQPAFAAVAALAVLTSPGGGTFSAVGIPFFLERLGWVVVLALLCKQVSSSFQPAWLVTAGRASLVMYAVHLVIISLVTRYGVGALGTDGTAILYVGVLASTFLIAACLTSRPRVQSVSQGVSKKVHREQRD